MSDAFGRWLQDELEYRGWPRAELARRIGVHPGTVARWVSGKTRIEPENCRKVAQALGIPEAQVLEAAGYAPELYSAKAERLRGFLQAARALARQFALTPSDIEVIEEELRDIERRRLQQDNCPEPA